MSLQGQIEEMGLGAVIQTLSLNRYMGTLRIETEDAGNQFLFLSEGEIVLVRQVQRDPVRLGDLLLRAKKIDAAQLEEALAEQKRRTSGRLGGVLVDLGMIAQHQIEEVIRGKFEEDVLDMFLLDRGRFEFIFGLSPEALFAPDEKLERVSLNAEGLMLEAMRRIDEWSEMFKSLGSLDTIYQNRTGSQSGTNLAANKNETVSAMPVPGAELPGPTRLALYGLLDGTRSLREVLAEAIRTRIASRRETFLFLHALYKGELVVPLDPKTLLNEARSALGAKDVPRAAKYIRAILGRKGEVELALVRRYLDFLKKNKRPKLAFDEARLFAAQALARGDSEQAIALYEEAVGLDFRNAEVLDRLFYTLLRANRRERALQVGLSLRDHLGSEAGLNVATRVVRNLKEMAPDDAEVNELAGLVHKQREENEDAIRELEKALGKIGQTHPRRPLVVSALLELQPGREDLLAEKESTEVRAAREQIRREFRRRLLLVGALPTAALLLVLAVWTAWSESRARASLDRAQTLFEQGPGENLANWRESAALLGPIVDSWTVGGEATELKEKVDLALEGAMKSAQAEKDDLIRQRKEAQAKAEAEARRSLRDGDLDKGIASYRQLVTAGEFAAATARALEVRQAHADFPPQRLEELKVFVRVESEPSGAELYVDGRQLATTPGVVPVIPNQPVKLGLRLRGYRAVEEQLTIGGWETKRYALQPGPVWRQPFAGAPLAPLGTWKNGVVLAEAGGKVTPLSFVDGRPLWSPPARDALAAIQKAGHPRPDRLEWAVAAGPAIVAGSGATLVSWELSTGELAKVVKLPNRTRFYPPVALRLRGQDLLLLVEGRSALLVNPTGAVVQEVTLPAPAVRPPGVGGGKAFIPVQGDQLVAVDLSERAGRNAILWQQSNLPAVSAPLYSERSEAIVVRGATELRTVRAIDGQVLAALKPELGPLLGAAVVDERVYVLSQDGLLAGLGVYDGEPVVQGTKVAEKLQHGPLLLGKDLVVVDAAGEVIRISLSGRRRPGPKLDLGGPATAVEVAADRLIAAVEKAVVLVEPSEE